MTGVDDSAGPSPEPLAGPVSDQVYRVMKQRIRAGDWPIGAKLPSLNQLATEYGCSVSTIQRAIGWLRRDGVIRGQAGAGMFVTKAPAPEPPDITQMAADLEDMKAQLAEVRRQASEALEESRRTAAELDKRMGR